MILSKSIVFWMNEDRTNLAILEVDNQPIALPNALLRKEEIDFEEFMMVTTKNKWRDPI